MLEYCSRGPDSAVKRGMGRFCAWAFSVGHMMQGHLGATDLEDAVRYGLKVDIYAAGVVLYMALLGRDAGMQEWAQRCGCFSVDKGTLFWGWFEGTPKRQRHFLRPRCIGQTHNMLQDGRCLALDPRETSLNWM